MCLADNFTDIPIGRGVGQSRCCTASGGRTVQRAGSKPYPGPQVISTCFGLLKRPQVACGAVLGIVFLGAGGNWD